MKKAIMFAIMICVAVSAADLDVASQRKKRSQPAGRVTEGFQVSALAKNELVVSGEPASLRVRIKNVTNNVLYLAEVGVEKDYEIRISRDVSGTIPLTAHGRVLRNTEGDFYSNVGLSINPGQEREDVLEVSNIYDMTLPGNYWIVVRRKVGKLIGKGVTQAESNTVRIQVVKKK
jgi:hypothetical protein